MDCVKLAEDVAIEVGTEHLAWILSLMTTDGEIPRYAMKYIVVVAAE